MPGRANVIPRPVDMKNMFFLCSGKLGRDAITE
jgi:hypothetical protein